MEKKCALCGIQLKNKADLYNGLFLAYNCEDCGTYSMSLVDRHYFTEKAKDVPDAIVKIRRVLALESKQVQFPSLSKDKIDSILEQPLPSVKQRADSLLRLIGERSGGLGSLITLKGNIDKLELGVGTIQGFKIIVNYLNENKYISIEGNPKAEFWSVFLTFKGWEYYEDLKKGGQIYHQAFMAMKFGDDQLDGIVKNIFTPSVKQTGFDLIRLDDRPKAGLIDDRLRVEIQSSDFLIADLTHDNLGAYWEAGYAEGLRKPVIYTCKADKFEESKTHFDTNHHLTVVWDPGNPQGAGEQLKVTIRATLPGVAKMRDD